MERMDCLQRGIDYIEKNLRAQITAGDIARECGFSLYHFYRLFAQTTGLSVMQYVTKRRLIHAAYDIHQGMSVTDAAYIYGFDSLSGFIRAFRREFGLSPREYLRINPPARPEKIILKEMKHIMISKKLLSRALSAWNLDSPPESILHSSGFRSENTFLIDRYLLTAQPNRAPVAVCIAAEQCLLEAGLPAAQTILLAGGEPIFEADGLYFRLTTAPKGNFIPAKEMYTDLSRPRMLGQALARLHKALEPLSTFPELNHPDLLNKTLTWSLPESARCMQLPDSFVRDFTEQFSRLYPNLPVSPIHRNPTPDAFLFENGCLSGYNHFEMTEINIRLFDPCYAATSILSETLHRIPSDVTDRWPEVLSAILQGYHEVAPLTEAEKAAVPYVIAAIQMICVAYFSSQSQFKALAETNISMTRQIISWLFPDATKS